MTRATNATAEAELLNEAKHFGIDLSKALQEAIEAKIKAKRMHRWGEENRVALQAYGQYLDDNELVADRLRAF